MTFLPAVVMVVPAFEAFGFGSIDFPTLGAYLAAGLIAALIGSALGILREHGRNVEIPKSTDRTVPLRPVAHPVDMAHKAAA